MHRLSLYFRLACTNIKANYRLYVPYLLASSGMVMLFYIILNLSMDPGFTCGVVGYLAQVLGMGSFVVGLFAVVFILYINGFLMKRRGKEFGLYNILGMEKKQISEVILVETIISYVIAMVSGILLGTLFSKLVQLLLLRLIQYGGDIQMTMSLEAVIWTLVLFAVIYMIEFLGDIRKIWKVKPTDMFSEASAGERVPKANWLVAVIGVITLGAGYFLAQYVKSPVEAFSMFFIAVALVMVGTLFLFTSGSVAFLKILQKNKKYYYKKNHFINVSGMIYRMKQNAVGLSQICILSCMVLVTISMTVALYVGVEDMLTTVYGDKDINVTAYVISQQEVDTFRDRMITDINGHISDETYYIKNSEFLITDPTDQSLSEYVGNGTNSWDTAAVFSGIDDYNRLTNCSIDLDDDEVAVYCDNGENFSQLTYNGKTYTVKENLKEIPKELEFSYEVDSTNNYREMLILVKDPYAIPADYEMTYSLHENFNSDLKNDEQIAICKDWNQNILSSKEYSGYANCMAQDRSNYYVTYGGFLFVGIFLGGLFLIATVLIIYYKQVSEGYEDRGRYRILQQVGLSRKEVRKSINAQVLAVFFIPLAVAFIHIIFAFHIVYELMLAFGLSNVSLFMTCMLSTVGIFAIIYTIVYWITSGVYYHIIEQQ